MHSTSSSCFPEWARSSRLRGTTSSRRCVLSVPARCPCSASLAGRPVRRGRYGVGPQLLLAWPCGAALSRVLPRCQPTVRHDVAAIAAIVSSLRCASGPVGCRAHVAMLAVAMPLMALRRAGHAGRERACLSASAWTWVSTVASTTSSQGAHMPSHRPYPTPSLCFSSLCRRRAAPTCEPESGHLYSILPVCTFALPSSHRMTPHSHDDALAKRQFGSFPPVCR